MNEPQVEKTVRFLLSIDLAGFTKIATTLDAEDVARFLHGYYCKIADTAAQHDGTVIKFIGDACLITFASDAAGKATACALALANLDTGRSGVEIGINVHVGTVAEGRLGPGAHARLDVVGSQVNNLFRMGGGPGIRLSAPAFERLPADARKAWKPGDKPSQYVPS